MKKIKIIFSICLLVVLTVISAKSQTCPNIPKVYYTTTAGLVPAFAKYNNGTYPPQSFNYSNYTLTVTWTTEGQGFVAYSDGYSLEIHVAETISSGFAFSSAPSLLCNNQAGTFTIVDNCGTSFTWSAPSGSSINGGGNTLVTSSKSVTISIPSSSSGNFQISITSNLSLNRTTNGWLGTYGSGAVSWSVSGSPLCVDQTYYPTADPLPGATYYDWITSSGWYVSGQGTRYLSIRPSSTEGGMIGLRIDNSCGTGGPSYLTQYYSVISCGGGYYRAIASPNPASSELNVELLESPNGQDVSLEELKLFDKNGSLVREIKEKGKKVKINLVGLPKGQYYLSVLVNGEVSKQRIVID